MCLPPVKDLMAQQAEMVCLIKPQFEAGKEKVGKKGVVRDSKVHYEVVETTVKFAMSLGFQVLHLDFSPIKGPEGNIEYLMHLQKGNKTKQGQEQNENQETGTQVGEWEKLGEDMAKRIEKVIAESHQTLNQ